MLVINREKDRHQTLKSAVCHDLAGRHRDREIPPAFCAICSQIELPALHRRYFELLPVALDQEALPKEFSGRCNKTLRPLTLPRSPSPEARENPLIAKQGSLTFKDP